MIYRIIYVDDILVIRIDKDAISILIYVLSYLFSIEELAL